MRCQLPALFFAAIMATVLYIDLLPEWNEKVVHVIKTLMEKRIAKKVRYSVKEPEAC
jgi:hypothetical protein